MCLMVLKITNRERVIIMKTKLVFPGYMKFVFKLSARDCYKRFSNKCALNESGCKGMEDTWLYCRAMYEAIKNKTIDGKKEALNILITKYRCGHYAINDGQHRLCIAKRTNRYIYAEFSGEISCDCPVCCGSNLKNSNYFIF